MDQRLKKLSNTIVNYSVRVKENDRVLISSYTFLATALAVIAVGAIPVPIEIDLDTGLNIDDLKQIYRVRLEELYYKAGYIT